jgi:hypothetical protein
MDCKQKKRMDLREIGLKELVAENLKEVESNE